MLLVCLASLALGAPEPLVGPDGPLVFGPFEGPGAAPIAGRERIWVDPRSGQLHAEATELHLPVAGPDLVLSRRWTGSAWAWSYQDSLLLDGQRVHIDRQGERTTYVPDGDAQRLPTEQGGLTPWPIGSSFNEGALTREQEGWVLREGARIHRYDLDGRLLSFEDPSGASEVTWDDLDRPAAMVSGDTALRLFFDAERQLSVISGGQERYVEHRDGRLIGISGQGRARVRYVYDERGRLRTILWADGSQLQVRYDDQDRVTELSGPGTWSQRYSYRGETVTVRDALGATWTLSLRPDQQRVQDPSGREVSVSLDSDGHRRLIRDPRGLELRLSRDDQGRIREIEAPGGRRWRLSWEGEHLSAIQDALGNTWRYERNERGQLTGIVDPMGRRQAYSRSPGGELNAIGGERPVRLSRDSHGLVDRIHWPNGAMTKLRWDRMGRLEALRDPGGEEILIPRREKGRVAELLGRMGAHWELDRDALGRLRRLIEPSGVVWELDREPGGRLRRLDRQGQPVLGLTWRSNGLLTRIQDAFEGEWGLPLDPLGRPSALLEPDGQRTELRWDPIGNLVQLGSVPIEREPGGLPLQAQGRSWAWDGRGALTQAQGRGVDLVLNRGADGRVRSLEIGGETTRLSRDAEGDLVGAEGPAGSARLERGALGEPDAVHGSQSLLLKRDDRGLVVIRSVGPVEQRLLYDSAGWLVRQSSTSAGSLSVARHTDGSLQMVRFPDGSIARIEQGPQSWTQVVEDPGGAPILDHRETLDPLGRTQKLAQRVDNERYREQTWHRSPRGQIVAVEAPGSAWFWSPDSVSRSDGAALLLDTQGAPALLEEEGISMLGAQSPYRYLRDDQGCLAALVGSSEVTLALDGLGRLIGISGPEGAWRLDWDPLGQLAVVDGPRGRWRLHWALGALVAVETDSGWLEVLGGPELGWAWLGAGQSLGLVVDRSGTPQLALPQAEAVDITPFGLSRAAGLMPLGPGGSLQIEGFLIDGAGAWDGLSGTRLCSLEAPGAPQASWSDPRWGWDPEPWLPSSAWSDPLTLLQELGELPLLLDEPLTDIGTPAGALPGWPAASAAPRAPLAPAPTALPLDLDPVERLLLQAVSPPVQGVDPEKIRRALLAPEFKDQAIFSTPAGGWIPVPF